MLFRGLVGVPDVRMTVVVEHHVLCPRASWWQCCLSYPQVALPVRRAPFIHPFRGTFPVISSKGKAACLSPTWLPLTPPHC